MREILHYRSTNITLNHNIPRYLQGKFEANTQYYFKFNILWESYTDSEAYTSEYALHRWHISILFSCLQLHIHQGQCLPLLEKQLTI